jgi:hypothetical protein
MVLDSAVAGDGYNADTACLIVELATRIATQPSTWELVADLFPRPQDMATIPHWECDPDEPELAKQVADALSNLTAHSTEDQARIPDIVKYNSLSIESNAEQLCTVHLGFLWFPAPPCF